MTSHKGSVCVKSPRIVASVRSGPKEYAGHSFRIGMATTASHQGVSEATIKMLGRWESSAYLRYIKTPRGQLASISSRLSN